MKKLKLLIYDFYVEFITLKVNEEIKFLSKLHDENLIKLLLKLTRFKALKEILNKLE